MEKTQTALHELIAFIDEIDADAMTKGYIDIDFSNACNEIKEKALLLIDKEKEQMRNVYKWGTENRDCDVCSIDTDDEDFEDRYTDTYETKL